jgi:nucleotide-binding universal stress UspA family protein
MTAEGTGNGGRIVVALDDSPHARAALEAAALLAARWGAELVGVFVEDLDLLRIAELPFALGLSRYAPRPRELTREDMERALRLQGQRLRHELEVVALRNNVRWVFRTMRGRVAAELLAAAEGALMLVLGKASTARVRGVQVGRTARLVVSQATHTVVLLQHGAEISRPVLVIYDGSPAGDRALATAVAIAKTDHGHMVVLLSRPADATLQERAIELLGSTGVQARFVETSEQGREALLTLVRVEGCKTLVLNPQSAPEVSVPDLARDLDCPVVVVR